MKQMIEKKQQTKDHVAGEDATTQTSPGADTAVGTLDARMLLALHAASDKKALDLIALDLRVVASFTEYFLIASGANIRQVQAIADEILERLKKEMGERAARVEGYQAAEWVLLDYGDFIVHIFEDKARRFYDLERLWRDAARVPLPPELASGGIRHDEAAPGGSHEGSLRNER